MDIDQLDLDFGHEPALVAPPTHLHHGQRALRRRRLAQGLGGGIAGLAVVSVGWAALPGAGTAADQPYSAKPTPVVTRDLPVVVPDDCLGDVCVELVPHGMDPLSPGTPAGDMALGFRDGQLVRFSSAVHVVKAIEDPTASGATESAAVEVIFRDTRFRVALAEGFGYLIDQIGSKPSISLEQWFAAGHALPDSGCGIQVERQDLPRSETPEPGECWLEVNKQGDVVAHAGGTLTRQFDARLPAGSLPPGVRITGVEFERNGTRWFGVVRQIGDGAFVNTTLARTDDFDAGTTLEHWVEKTAPETSMTGIPDAAQPAAVQLLNWWDPRTGEFLVPDGVDVVRRVDNPLERSAAENSVGLIFDFRGKRYWALTEVRTSPSGDVTDGFRSLEKIRTAGVTASQAEPADSSADFDTWLAQGVAERTVGEETP